MNQEKDGSFPYGVNMFSQPGIRTFGVSAATCPFIAWEAWNAYLWSGDKEFLREAYDRCSRSYRYWMRTRDRTGEGLVCWIGYGETVRDDGDLETWRYKGAPIFFQEALDLNCYLLNMESVLADMSAELGDEKEEELYREAWKATSGVHVGVQFVDVFTIRLSAGLSFTRDPTVSVNPPITPSPQGSDGLVGDSPESESSTSRRKDFARRWMISSKMSGRA